MRAKYWIFLFLLMGYEGFAVQAPKRSLAEVKALVGIENGQYSAEVVGTSDQDFCANEILNLEWIDDQGSLTLSLGAQISMPNLELQQKESVASDSCRLKFVTEVKAKKLIQTVAQKCPEVAKNFEKKHIVQNNQGQLTYSYSVSEQSQSKPNQPKAAKVKSQPKTQPKAQLKSHLKQQITVCKLTRVESSK